ncbi:MAG TPA: nitrous oxide reductase family maturation protein NosD, partial [bacterium]|nr:nitrous oxide reductase family maturation protein NosD [bacterium]
AWLLGALPAGGAPAFDLQAELRAADSGGTLHVPAGVHPGPFTLDRPVTLAGEPGAVLQGNGKGDVLKITAPDVTLRGLTIRGTGTSLDQENAGVTVLADRVTVEDCTLEDVLFGVYLKDAADCVIRGNRIRGMDLELARRGDAIRIWHSDRCVIEDNEVHDARDVVIWFSKDVLIARNTVRRGRYGLHFMYSDSNHIEDNWLEGNSVGAFLMYSKNLHLERNVFLGNRGPSGYGIGLKDMDGVTAHDNRFLGNRVGIYLDNSPSSVDIHDRYERNVLAYNDIGIAFLPAVQRNAFVDNAFLENQEQVAVLGSGDFKGNDFTVDGRGNFWSDYAGYDLDEDGLGDVPYKAESLFESLVDREKMLRLFLYGPAQQAVELAARAMPAFKPRPKVTDTAPLTAPVAVEAPPLPGRSARPLGLLSGGLFLGSLLALGGVARRNGERTAAETATPGTSAPTPTAEPAPGRPVVSVRGLVKRFGRFTAVDGLDLDVAPGEALALWGHNGAGKTTAIKCLLGLLPCRGEIRVAGRDLRRDGKGVRRALGYVPQELTLHDDLRTRETVAFYARLKKVPAVRVGEVLEEVGMTAHERKRISELSGGMKQRVALAIALLADPPVLVLDEMTSNLDASSRRGFLELLSRQRERGKTILFTSHRLEEVQMLADRVLVLENGRAMTECAPDRLAATLGLRARLHLRIPDEDRDAALERLASGGFEAWRNGGPGIHVRVAPEQKAGVLRCLDAAGLRILDFELENDSAASRTGREE